MESHDEFSSSSDHSPNYGLFQHSASVESSPPISSSSTSESHSKLSSSSISDEDLAMLSKLCVSQEGAAEDLHYPMGYSSYSPAGIYYKTSGSNDTGFLSQNHPMHPKNGIGQGNYFQPKSHVWGRVAGPTFAAMTSRPNWENKITLGAKQYGSEGRPQRKFEDYHVGVGELSLASFIHSPLENAPFFPLAMVPEAPRTTIHVYSDRKVSYADGVVSFVIQVLNPPQGIQMHPRMFQASVVSPKGVQISSRVRSSDSYIINSFVGSFKAEEDAGQYKVHVRMILPMDQTPRYRNLSGYSEGAIHGITHIAVSKNYCLDSQKDCLRIKCDFHPTDQKMEDGEVGANGFDLMEVDQQQTHVGGHGHPGGQCKLWGLTCDLRNNNLLYTDREAHQVYCVTPDAKIVLNFGQNKSVPSSQQLCRPTGIAFDEAHSRLVVCDKDNHRICFFSLDGQFISSFGYRGHKNGAFEYPWDVAVAPNGNVVVSDSKNKRIQLFDRLGNYISKYTVYEVNPFEYRTQFDYPRGICFDNDGSSIYITDFNVNNVIKIASDLTGPQKILPHGTLLRPQGLTMDPTGNILVTDSRHDCVRYMNSRGEHLCTIRDATKEPMVYPLNVTTMAGGFVAILTADGRITIF